MGRCQDILRTLSLDEVCMAMVFIEWETEISWIRDTHASRVSMSLSCLPLWNQGSGTDHAMGLCFELWFVSPPYLGECSLNARSTWRNKKRLGSSLSNLQLPSCFDLSLLPTLPLPSADDCKPPGQVIGSDPLERQIRELGSDVHIFGHTHIPIDMTSDGVRYVQWPLGELPRSANVVHPPCCGGGFRPFVGDGGSARVLIARSTHVL